MSLFSGLAKVGSWFSGNSFGSNLAKTALLGYTMYRLQQSLNKNNKPDQQIDEGVRLQLNPSAENRVPVVYGSAFLSGIITDAEMSNNSKTMHFALAISEKTGTLLSDGSASTTEFKNVFWNDQRIIFKSDGVTVDYTQDRNGVIDRSLDGRVRVYCYDGNSATPRAVVGTNPPSLASADQIMPSWTSNHLMGGLVFAIVRVDYDRDNNVTSLGTVKFEVANSITRTGDALYDYLTNQRYGCGVPAGDVDTASLNELTDYSEQSVIYEDQILGPDQALAARYRINGVVNTELSVLENADNLASSAGSWLSYNVPTGQWSVVINRPGSPIVSFNDSTVIGNVSVSGTGIRDLYNRVKVDFPNRDVRDVADFVTIALPEAERNQFEYENTLNLVYDLINEPVQAELLGFIELKQSRVDLVVRFTTDYSYRGIRAGDLITLTNSRVGWTDKIFRVIATNDLQDDTGELITEITALEYQPGVYSTADLFRFDRTDQNGIIAIGAIGQPNIPQVTKVELSSNPRITVITQAPNGIVEGLEYWRTADINLPESQRNYVLVGTQRPTSASSFDVGQTVTFTYDTQLAGNFLIKVRGFNSVVSGPFSEPSGIIEFAPQQTPDVIGPDTQLAGLIGALGALELLNLVDGLFRDDAGEGGLFDKVFSIFKDETGVDLVGDAAEGTLVVASDISVESQGQQLTSALSTIDFAGGLTASAEQSKIVAKLIEGKNNKDILAWNAEEKQWQLLSSNGDISAEFPEPPPPEIDPDRPNALSGVCYLNITGILPNDRPTWQEQDGLQPPSQVPYTGPYFIRYRLGNVLLTAMQQGSGTARLYESNGTLVSTVTASQAQIDNNIIRLDFLPRKPGTDYYILMDDGFVTYCGCDSPGITNPRTWNFVTAPYEVAPYDPPVPAPIVFPTLPDFTPTVTPNAENICVTGDLAFEFIELIEPTSGTFTIVDNSNDQVVTTINVQSGILDTIEEVDQEGEVTIRYFVKYGALTDYPMLQRETVYRIEVPRGSFTTARTTCGFPKESAPQRINQQLSVTFSILEKLDIVDYQLFSDPFELEDETFDPNKVNIRSNIKIFFNRTITVGSNPNPIVDLYSNGQLVQRFNLKETFDDAFISDTFLIYSPPTPEEVEQLQAAGEPLPQIPATANQLILNPTDILNPGTNYYVTIAPGAIEDIFCKEQFQGVGANQITWRTDEIVITPVAPLAPGQTLRDSPLVLEFDRPVEPGTGSINIYDDQGNLVIVISNTDPAVIYED